MAYRLIAYALGLAWWLGDRGYSVWALAFLAGVPAVVKEGLWP